MQISNIPFVDQYTAHTLITFKSAQMEVKRSAPAKCDSVRRNNYIIKCDFPVFSSQCVCLPMFSSLFPSIISLVTEMKQPWFPVRWKDIAAGTQEELKMLAINHLPHRANQDFFQDYSEPMQAWNTQWNTRLECPMVILMEEQLFTSMWNSPFLLCVFLSFSLYLFLSFVTGT